MLKIVVEKTRTGFSAYSPEIDGCVAVGRTEKEVRELYMEALVFHKEGLEYDKENI